MTQPKAFGVLEKVNRIDGLLAIERELRSLLDSRLKRYGVTYAQFSVLRYVCSPVDRYGKPLGRPARHSDVAAWFDYASRTVTEVVTLLCKDGLVERTVYEADRRSRILTASARGRRLIDQAEPVVDLAYSDIARHLSLASDFGLDRIIRLIRHGIADSAAYDERHRLKR